MPTRLPLFKLPILVVLLALSGLLLAGAAHAAQLVPHATPLVFEEEFAAEEEGEEDEGEFEIEEGACEEAEEEFDEGELSGAEVKEICEEEKSSEHQATAHPHQGKAKHRHPHKKACRQRATAGKRHCPHRPRRG